MNEARSATVRQVQELVSWIGAGRKLTQTGRVTLADARVLVELLDTGDRMDAVIGERMFKTKSSEELYHLNLLVDWAKAARLLRVTAGRLVPVKKNARLLERPERLWDALFNAVPDIGGAVLVSGWLDSVFAHEYGDGLRVLLHRLYEAAGPVGFEEVATAVWQVASAPYVLDELTAEQLHGQRLSCDRDVRRVVDALASLEAVQGGEGG